MTDFKTQIPKKYLKIPDEAYKKSSVRIKYTESMKAEVRRCKKDPEYFLRNYYYIQTMVGNAGKMRRKLFEPFDYQLEMIDNFLNNRDNIAMLARQMGKTTLVGGLILWFSMFHKDETVLICANNRAQSMEIMERIQFGYEHCPDFIRAAIKNEGYAKGHVYFSNGSKIISRATGPHSGRGLTPSLLYVDEFAAIHPNMQADFWAAISQSLSTGGRAFITSTPYTEYDTFADIWRGANRYFEADGTSIPTSGPGQNGFKAIIATWQQHPDRDEVWEKKERSRINDDQRFEREQNCAFVGYSETLIEGMFLKRILEDAKQRQPLKETGQVKWWKRPEARKTYLVGYDPSIGTGGDFAAMQVFELPGMIQVAEWMSKTVRIPEQLRILRGILQVLDEEMRFDGDNQPEIYWSVENNTIGEAALIVIDEMGEENFPGEFLTETKKTRGRSFRKGYNTTNRSKLTACARMKNLVEKHAMQINSAELSRQLSFFVAAGAGYAAKLGEHDDLVMSTILVIRMLEQVMWYDEEKTEDLRDSIQDAEVEPMGIF